MNSRNNSNGHRSKLDIGQRNKVQKSLTAGAAWIYGCFILLGIVIVVFTIRIQLGTSSDELIAQGERIAYFPDRIEAARGNILSDDGRILATSIPYYDIRIDFAAPSFDEVLFQSEVTALSESLSEFFEDKSATEYEMAIREAHRENKRYYSLTPRDVNYVELQKIKNFPFLCQGARKCGFIAQKSYRRVKPLGDIANRTIGFVNSNGVKLGIEGAFDDILRGVEGLAVKEKISGNFWIPIASRLNIDPIDGLDVTTTIDIEIQDIAQSALRSRVKEVDADWGTVAVMEISTGHIKALTNITRNKEGEMIEDYNYAVGMSQEPGSTFKLPVLLTLLEDGGMSLNDIVDAEGGVVMIGEAKVVDTRGGGYGKITLEEAFVQSSNIGMAKAVNRIYEHRPAKFVSEIERIHLGRELGLQIAGEPRPTIKHPDVRESDWDGTSLTMMSYGYALRLTPLQTLSIYSAVANGGKMMRPKLVTSLSRGGEIIEQFEDEVIDPQIASPRVIAELQRALRAVVERGTAKSLNNPKYSVAAKTGTAQIAMGSRGYMTSDGSRHYLSSIAGYFPANNPKYAMIVAVKTFYKAGSDKLYYAGALAAPVFGEIADGIYSNNTDFVAPFRGKNESLTEPKAPRISVDSLKIPRVVGMSFDDAVDILEKRGYSVSYKGFGRVVSQDTLSSRGEILLRLSM